MTTVTVPGIYDIDEAEYHADPCGSVLGRSLSVSGAKVLLDCPAKFAHQRENGQPPRDVYDFGHAAHALTLGAGLDLVTIDADDWRGKTARDAKATARAQGQVPLLRADMAQAQNMADRVKAHPLAAAVLSEGQPEKSLFWVDTDTGVTCRGRVDWLRDNAIVDVKTCADASPGGFAKAAANFGYDMQADYYTTGVETLTGHRLPFLFIAVEKQPPHLVAVYQLDDAALDRGNRRNREALQTYATCESTGVWPGYSDDVTTLSLPRWATY